MAGWDTQCLTALRALAADPKFWNDGLKPLRTPGAPPCGVHLGIFVEPFLTFILDGRKTVESRFSTVKCAPYARVSAGDIIMLKKAAGPVVGLCRASSAHFYELDAPSLSFIRQTFAKSLCVDDAFWNARREAAYATLITVVDVISIPPIHVSKKDRRGWVVVSSGSRPSELFA
jgi:hypothetical protein